MVTQASSAGTARTSVAVGAIALLLGGATYWWFTRQVDEPATSQTRHFADFPAGSQPVYSADFKHWPISSNQFGSSELNANATYLLKPIDNRWFSGGPAVTLPPLEKDFLLTVGFRIPQGDPAIQIQLLGDSASSELLTLSLRRNGSDLSYHLEKQDGARHSDPVVIVEQAFVPAAAAHDWSTPGKLTLKRTGDTMELFANDQFLREFPASRTAYTTLVIAAAQKGIVELTSAEVRTPSS